MLGLRGYSRLTPLGTTLAALWLASFTCGQRHVGQKTRCSAGDEAKRAAKRIDRRQPIALGERRDQRRTDDRECIGPDEQSASRFRRETRGIIRCCPMLLLENWRSEAKGLTRGGVL